MKSNVWLWLRLFVALVAVSLGNQALQAQCVGPTTAGYYYTDIFRVAGNDFQTLAGTTIEGNYYFNWTGSVNLSMYRDGFVFSGRQNLFRVAGGGGSAFLFNYHDLPSISGPGVYSTNTVHEALCTATNPPWYYGPINASRQLVVFRPTINAGASGVWWLGAVGAHDAPNGYYPTAALVAQKNCLAGDTCNEAPVWSITQNPQKLSLSGS